MKISPLIENSWKKILEDEFQKEYMKDLKKFLISEKEKYMIFPKGSQIFNAFNYTPFNKIKVVILGQDPYHGEGQAHGLSFSVPNGIQSPPSLVNIFNEIKNDLNIDNHGKSNLEDWAKQGVLLINSTLTVRAHNPGSHQNKGWEKFTDRIISLISENKNGIIFLLWGKYAKEKSKLIDTVKHHILSSSHPSPLSSYRGFLGCKHFSKCNNLLIKQKRKEINWQLS